MIFSMDQLISGMEGVDTDRGLVNCGGSMEAYLDVLESFLEDSTAKLRELKPFQKKNFHNIHETELHWFAHTVHAVKGVSAIIGAQDLSKKAAGLEKAAKGGDREIMQKDFPDFYNDIKTIIERVQFFLKDNTAGEG